MPPDAVSALRFPTTEPTSRAPLADADLQSAYWPTAAMFGAATRRALPVCVLPDRVDVRRCGRCVQPGARRQGDVDDDRSPAGEREAALARQQHRAVSEVADTLTRGRDRAT